MILIDVRKEEQGKVFLIWAMSALLAAGYVIGWTAVNAMLVKRLGVDYLPYIYIGISLLGIAGSSIYLMFADTLRRDKLLILFSAATGIVLLMSRFFVSARHEGGTTFSLSLILFFVLVLFAQGVGNSMLGTQIWTIANDVFRPSQGKRLYPIIGTAGIVGGILGGLFIQTLVSRIGTANLIVVWALAVFLIIPLTMIFRKRYGGELHGMKGPSNDGMIKNEGRIKNLKECHAFFMSSPLMKVLVAVAALFWIVGSFQDFQYTRIMNATFTTEETLSKFYGYYAIGFNIVAIFIQAFLTGRILGRIGVGRGLSVLPFTVLAGFGAILSSFTFIPGLFLRFSWDMIGTTVQGNSFQLALNAVPGRLRARVRGVIDGVINPMGGILGGTVILILRNIFSHKTGVSSFDIITIAGIVLSGFWLFLTLGGQKKYIHAIVDNLKDKDRQTFMDAVESLDERGNPMAIQKLLAIVQTEDKAARLAALRTLTRLGYLPALRVITQLMSNPDEELRMASIQAVRKFTTIEQNHFLSFYFKRRMERFMTEDKSSMVRSEAARYLIEHQPVRDMPYFVHDMLDHPDPMVRCKVIEALSELKLDYMDFSLEDMVDNPSPEVRAAAIVALWQVSERKAAVGINLLNLLEGKSSEEKAAGLKVLVKTGAAEFLPHVGPLLGDSDLGVQALAALAYLALGNRGSAAWDKSTERLITLLISPALTEYFRQEILPLMSCLKEEGLDAIIMGVVMLPEQDKEQAATVLQEFYWIYKKYTESIER